MHIRSAKREDLPALRAIFSEDVMGLPDEEALLQGLVAVDEGGDLLGFIRILQVLDEVDPLTNGNYVYPVIVSRKWQEHGVGRALIHHARKLYGPLKLVACQASRGFYPRCGFELLAWDQVASIIARDCELCPDLSTCDPQPFILP